MQSNGPTTTLARLVRRLGKGGQTTGNRCRMRSGRAMQLVLMSVVSLAVSLASVGEVDASCGSSQRVKSSSAECLGARWSNRGNWVDPSSEFYASSSCSSYGKVVAKVDLKSASDRTWHLTNAHLKQGTANAHVRQIYCCKDLSVLCNRSDVVNPDGCKAQFEKSPAKTDDGCILNEAPTATAEGNNFLSCNFPSVACPKITNHFMFEVATSSLSQVRWFDADELINCNGTLRRAGSC